MGKKNLGTEQTEGQEVVQEDGQEVVETTEEVVPAEPVIVIVGSTTLYERTLDGVHVNARQEVIATPVAGKEGETVESKRYLIEATFNGEPVSLVEGSGYRQTIFDGRTTFKNVYHDKVGQFAAAKAAEEAAKVADEKAKKEQERQAKAQAKADEAAKKAQEKADAAAKKAAEAQAALNKPADTAETTEGVTNPPADEVVEGEGTPENDGTVTE